MGDEPVWIERHKWPDRPHYRWPMVPVGEDEHGLWLRMHPDGPILKGDGIPSSARRDGLRLVSWTEPWCAWFPTRSGSSHPPDQTWRLYVDIIDSAVVCRDGTITMVDLDLDVVQYLDGRVELLDEDEFVEHQVRYGYPAEIVELAQSAGRSVLDAVQRGEPPFDGAAAATWATRAGIDLGGGPTA